MELFESLEDSAKREMEEETHCTIKINRLVAVISVPEIGQVHHFFQADLLSFSDQPTAESERVSLFNPTEIPWEQLAFRTVRRALQSFLQNPNALLVANLARDRSMSRLE